MPPGTTDFGTHTDFGVHSVIVLQTLASNTEEVNKASIVTEDSTDFNAQPQTLAAKITDFGT